jgi:hypothetical protein
MYDFMCPTVIRKKAARRAANGLTTKSLTVCPSGPVLYVSGATSADADYAKTGCYRAATSGTVTYDGWINLATDAFLTYHIGSGMDGLQTLAYRCNFKRTGSLSSFCYLLKLKNLANTQNTVYLYTGSGSWFLKVFDGTSAVIIDSYNFGTMAPVLNQSYEVELDMDLTTGASRLFIDGVELGSACTVTGTRPLKFAAETFGVGPLGTAAVKNLQLFTSVQHTANYTPIAAVDVLATVKDGNVTAKTLTANSEVYVSQMPVLKRLTNVSRTAADRNRVFTLAEQTISYGTVAAFNDLSYFPQLGIFVACCSGGYVGISVDGISWSWVSKTCYNSVYDPNTGLIRFGAAAGNTYTLAYPAMTWATVPTGLAGSVVHIHYVAQWGKWLAFSVTAGSPRVAYSTDGASWSTTGVDLPDVTIRWVAYSPSWNKLLCVRSDTATAYTTSNGINYTAVTALASNCCCY